MFMYFLFYFDIPVPSVLLSFPSRYVRFVSPVFPSCFHFPHYPPCVYMLCVSLCFSLGRLCFPCHYSRCSFRFLVELFQIRVFFVYLSALLPFVNTHFISVCLYFGPHSPHSKPSSLAYMTVKIIIFKCSLNLRLYKF